MNGKQRARQPRPKAPNVLHVVVDLSPELRSYLGGRFDRIENFERASARREIAMAQTQDEIDARVAEINAKVASQKDVIAGVGVIMAELRAAKQAGATDAQLMTILEGLLGNDADLEAIRAGTPAVEPPPAGGETFE